MQAKAALYREKAVDRFKVPAQISKPALLSAAAFPALADFFSRASSRAFNSSTSSRAAAAIALTASNSSRLTKSNPPMNSRKRRSEEPTSELQSLMRISYAVLCLKKKQQ